MLTVTTGPFSASSAKQGVDASAANTRVSFKARKTLCGLLVPRDASPFEREHIRSRSVNASFVVSVKRFAGGSCGAPDGKPRVGVTNSQAREHVPVIGHARQKHQRNGRDTS